MRKVTSRLAKGKRSLLEEFDHFVSVDWSQGTMAIAHMRRRDKEPVVFERAAELKVLKEYLHALRGSTVLTVEETTTAHWLYLELRDDVDPLALDIILKLLQLVHILQDRHLLLPSRSEPAHPDRAHEQTGHSVVDCGTQLD
jgi:hypothetical protein